MANIVLKEWNETQDADWYTQKICDRVKNAVEELTGKTYEVFTGVKYRRNDKCGTHFLIKVYAGVEDYIHLCVLETYTPFLVRTRPLAIDTLRGVEQGRTKDSPLLSFVSTFGDHYVSASE